MAVAAGKKMGPCKDEADLQGNSLVAFNPANEEAFLSE